MPEFAVMENTQQSEFSSLSQKLSDTDTVPELEDMLVEIESLVPPLWPLSDYVAVNPFLGFSDTKFLSARQKLREVRDCDLLPPLSYFRTKFQKGEITTAHIKSAQEQCRSEYPELFHKFQFDMLTLDDDNYATGDNIAERRYLTIAEIVDKRFQSNWINNLTNDITRHCSSHFDEGQAIWGSPFKGASLYEAWRQTAQLSRRMDLLGIKGFREFVESLPARPEIAIAQLLEELEVPRSHWRPFLLCQLFSIAGWASYVKFKVSQVDTAENSSNDMTGLLAIRLAYDVALGRQYGDSWPLKFGALPAVNAHRTDHESMVADIVPEEALCRYVMQVAAETAYERALAHSLMGNTSGPKSSARKTAQMVFCIDVRSELMRRHLESVTDGVETFGFAGFFGMPLEHVHLGESKGDAHCPVLLKPTFRACDTVAPKGRESQSKAIHIRITQRLARKIWKCFQASATSCFSFVESIGLFYSLKLLTDSMRLTAPVKSADQDGLSMFTSQEIKLDLDSTEDLSSQEKAGLAEGMLRNLGLTDDFARILTFCGHEAQVANNPYKAGLDCGACGGHSGAPNARVAAALLNDTRIREELSNRSINIPDDTWFMAAVHNTTTDQIRFFETSNVPVSHAAELQKLMEWVANAGEMSRAERSVRFRGRSSSDITRRSRDWSEVRPEWGLAGNASFIIAPRSRTRGLNLSGRAFLHSYDHEKDPDGKVLELIMTAPMIVTNWINLQYHASAVDNRSFGSGNKLIHNIAGQFGVLSGNGGDLTTGLPWQSLHDGENYQHEPLRLLVVIEATREIVESILKKHDNVRDLVSNGWLSLGVIDNNRFYKRDTVGEWILVNLGHPV